MRKLALILIGVSIAGSSLLYVASGVTYRNGHTYVITCDESPRDDVKLEEWIKSQEGIDPRSVIISRNDIEGAIVVSYKQTRSILGNPSGPNLSKEIDKLGYRKGTVTAWNFDRPAEK